MAVLLNATFATTTEGFSAGTRNAGEGADFAAGYFQVGASTTASVSFTAVTSGIVRTDLWFRLTDTELVSGASKNSFVYLLPTAGAVSSANSITTFGIVRDQDAPLTSSTFWLTYRDSAAFVNWPDLPLPRGEWLKLSVVQNWTALTFDVYLNDILWVADIGFANASAADFSRVVILGQAATPTTDFDGIRVESAWALSESVLIDHTFVGGSGEIETVAPTTEGVAITPQPWKIANDQTTFGGFTLGANGAAPDSSKLNGALVRCRPEGIFELEVRTSVAGVIHLGLWYRVWAGIHSALSTDRAYNVVRYSSAASAGSEWSHFVGGLKTDAAVQTSGSNLLAANTIYTLQVEARGRYVTCSIKAAAMTAGSYTAIFASPLLINSAATGARGQLSEEHAGLYVDTVIGATDNYGRRFRFTGAPVPNLTSI